MRYPAAACLALALLAGRSVPVGAADPDVFVGAAIAMHGDTKYPPGFTHFDYANPDAPKGGEVHEYAIGTFDNLNPYILKGVPAAGIGGVYDRLMVSSADEPFTEYGLVAQSIEVPKDRSWVIFTLRPEAKFHDGTQMTPDDVVWTFDTLKAKGHPFYAAYYRSVTKAEALPERKVKFTFAPGDNRELPLILGELPVLSKAFYASHPFEETTLEPPLGSGPYKVAAVDPGRSITYELVQDYWGKDLPVNKGLYNFGRIRFDYYRDDNVALEAFKAGSYDLREEASAKSWATGYQSPALSNNWFNKVEIPNESPQGMQAFAFNVRHDIFKDARVRDALTYGFDFEWSNKTLFYGQYTRTESFFSNSELASSGLPSPDELKLLEPLRDQIPPEVFTATYEAPKTDGSGNIRPNLATALKLLEQAGYVVKDSKMVDAKTGAPLSFEVLLDEPAFERVTQPFVQNLLRLGVDAHIRTVDTAQYKQRLDNFDFDMIVATYPESLSPGNEQRDFWSSESADIAGGSNYIGIKDKAIDKLVDLVIAAPDREGLETRVHALDRVLLWHHYVIPQWHLTHYRVAYWDKFGRPPISPKYALAISSWWIDPAKSEALARRRQAGN
jgi:microcin C transport system substrate-binding protein